MIAGDVDELVLANQVLDDIVFQVDLDGQIVTLETALDNHLANVLGRRQRGGFHGVEFPSRLRETSAGHCNQCRKWGGGPFLEIDCGSEVSFDGEENISVFDSSAWADRGFCRKCGSHLFYRLKESRQFMIPVGLFDNDQGLVFGHQVFIDEKPSYYSFADNTTEMTGAEMFAKYAPPQE